MNHFRQINTCGGHPVSAAVGLKVIQIVEAERLHENAGEIGAYILEQLQDSPLSCKRPLASQVAAPACQCGSAAMPQHFP